MFQLLSKLLQPWESPPFSGRCPHGRPVAGIAVSSMEKTALSSSFITPSCAGTRATGFEHHSRPDRSASRTARHSALVHLGAAHVVSHVPTRPARLGRPLLGAHCVRGMHSTSFAPSSSALCARNVRKRWCDRLYICRTVFFAIFRLFPSSRTFCTIGRVRKSGSRMVSNSIHSQRASINEIVHASL